MSTRKDIEYDLSSERWRIPSYVDLTAHHHTLDLVDKPCHHQSMYCTTRVWLTDSKESNCIFCQAHLTFDRTLEEILYHCNKWPRSGNYRDKMDKMLIEKWKNNIDAWDNPIGKNIKG